MFLATALMLVVQDAPTLAMVQRLPPAAAGELVLRGKNRQPIEAVVPEPNTALQPPGHSDLEMVERAVAGAEGCSRVRWRVGFAAPVGEPKDMGAMQSAYPSTEVALARGGRCPVGGYVRVNSGATVQVAFRALGILATLPKRSTRAEFACVDETSSNLCASPKAIRAELATLTRWAVNQDGDVVEFWLDAPGRAVTKVRFSLAAPAKVSVRRRVPPPA